MYSKTDVYNQTLDAVKEYYKGGGQINPDSALEMIHSKLTSLNEEIKE